MLTEAAALSEARRVLAYWLESGRLAETLTHSQKISFKEHDKRSGADIVVQLGNHLLLAVECKLSSDAAAVGAAIEQARRSAAELGRKSIPVVAVVAVPYMGEVGKRLCGEAGVSWLDLSGNGHIVAPGLAILVEGKPNKHTRRGRPSTAFGPRSSRVARLLLREPHRSFRQQELARESGLDDGFVSRIVRRLEMDHLVVREKEGIKARDPDLLLEAWREDYDFQRHTIVAGHVTSRAGEELTAKIARVLASGGFRYAATGLAAAWLHTHFAGFRLVTFFADTIPDEAILGKIGFRQEPKGANVWLVVPNDEGVFVGAEKKDGIHCVDPLQTYLDLKSQPERAKDAADEIRARLLRWNK
jgi:hypothetical protein